MALLLNRVIAGRVELPTVPSVCWNIMCYAQRWDIGSLTAYSKVQYDERSVIFEKALIGVPIYNWGLEQSFAEKCTFFQIHKKIHMG